jgi:hypothetical protein
MHIVFVLQHTLDGGPYSMPGVLRYESLLQVGASKPAQLPSRAR